MLLLVMILTTINSIMTFDLFWTLTKGGPSSATTVFSWLGYIYAFQFLKFGEGSAILYILTILCLLLAYIYLKILFPTVKRQGGKTAAQTITESADINGSLAQSLITATDRQRVAASPLLTRLSISTLQHRHSWLGVRMRRIMAYSGLRLAALLIAFWSIVPFLWLLIMSPAMNFIAGSLTVADRQLQFTSQDHTLSLGLETIREETLRAINGVREVMLAVRPTDMLVAAERELSLSGNVFLVEPIGPITYIDLDIAGYTLKAVAVSTYIDLDIAGYTLKAVADPDQAPQIGDTVKVGFSPSRVYIFDPTSELRL